MNELWWIGLAWLLFGIAALLVLQHRARPAVRHFPYEPRAELVRQAIQNQWPVRFVYWSQMEQRWLRRKLQPVSLAAGHLRAADPETGQSRRYEVARMRKLQVQGRCVAPPWSWQLPLALFLALVATGLAGYALRERWLARHMVVANTTANIPSWWRDPDKLPLVPLQLQPPSTTVTEPATARLAEPLHTNTVTRGTGDTWEVVLRCAPDQSLPTLISALQLVFLQARAQAVYLARQGQIHGQVVVWQGSALGASNYVQQLVRLGVPASIRPASAAAP